jgi:hypothetical protein
MQKEELYLSAIYAVLKLFIESHSLETICFFFLIRSKDGRKMVFSKDFLVYRSDNKKVLIPMAVIVTILADSQICYVAYSIP